MADLLSAIGFVEINDQDAETDITNINRAITKIDEAIAKIDKVIEFSSGDKYKGASADATALKAKQLKKALNSQKSNLEATVRLIRSTIDKYKQVDANLKASMANPKV